MLLPYLKSFSRRFPNIRITILCQSSNQTMELLDRGRLILVLWVSPENPKKYRFFQLEEIEDIFVATDNYIEQMGLGSLWDTRKIFETASVMLLDKQNMTRQYIDDYMEKNHLLTKNLLVVSTMDLIIEFSKIGLGIGCVIKEFVKDELEDGLLTEIPLGFPIHKRKIGFVTAKQAYMSPGVESFITQWEELSLSPGDRK